jgi:hypothetical protein
MAKGFQEFLGGAIQGFGQTFFPQLEQMRTQHLQRQQEAQQQSLLNQALTQAQKVYADPNLSPEQKQIGLFQALSNRPEIAKALGEQLISQQKAMQPKAPPGGLSGQPVPQEVSGAIQNVLAKNPEASADQLKAAFDAVGLPPAYTNPYVENRRESTKKIFEPTEEKLEAERVSKLADEISRDYQSAQSEDLRLNRMEKLSEKGDLSTPLMVKALETIGLPLGVLGNPDTEEYAKLESDFVRDVSKIFPGQIRVFEIQAYLKTIPGLMNSPEGRKAIIKNRKLINEAKEIKYDEYKKILKENGGKKPRNLDIMLEERTAPKINEIAEKFREGIDSALEKQLPKMKMYDKQGKAYEIPSHLIPQAQQQGLIFK